VSERVSASARQRERGTKGGHKLADRATVARVVALMMSCVRVCVCRCVCVYACVVVVIVRERVWFGPKGARPAGPSDAIFSILRTCCLVNALVDALTEIILPNIHSYA
jgi:hypothetical protein